jgi:serine/threonine protein phosphatase PrpC
MERACPHCGAMVRAEAVYCGHCGQSLAPPQAAASSSRPAPRVTLEFRDPPPVVAPTRATGGPTPAETDRARSGCWPLGWLKRRQPGQEAAAPAAPMPAGGAGAMQGPTRALREDEARGPWAARYAELERDMRSSFGFVAVADLKCANPSCGRQNQDGRSAVCAYCRQPLPTYLLRLSRVPREASIDPATIMRLSQEHPLILDHLAFWEEKGWYVTLLEYPAGAEWKPLFRMVPIADPRQVARWGIQVGEMLAFLHGRQVCHYAMTVESREGIVIHGGQARLSDLSQIRSIHGLSEADTQALLQRDIQFLARLVYYMATGQTRPLTGRSAFDGVFDRAGHKEYETIGSLLDDLKGIESGRAAPATLTFSTGQATHAGKLRPENQDSAFVLPMMRLQESRTIATALCVVADGMGGQEAGERASKIAYKTIAAEINEQLILPALKGEATRKLDVTPGDYLRDAILKANQRVYEVARQQGIKMGTTVTAALLDGQVGYVANVGDSRTYLLRSGVLQKVTEDHSLVASLVKAGMIAPEDVYQHPQRNQIYRSLGDKPAVEVDLFTLDLQRGDQLLLCSDGLWEMVRDPRIQEILSKARSAQAACKELVRAAYDAGGEDNITVAVVKVE